jgi:cytochrome c553
MSAERLVALRNPWFATAVSVTAVIAVAAAAAGFMVLPSLQTNARFAGLWDAICSAAGIVYAAPGAQPVIQADYQTTDVVVTPQMLRRASAVSIGRGATLAMQCTMCHGARGLSEADSPNLAGQYAPAIFKQLQDFKSGARTSAVMSPLVANLTGQDMRDLAAYYAYLPRLPGYHPAAAGPAPRIVASGAPMRNIAPCASCHGSVDEKTGSAWLEGESPVYLRAQLEAFAAGARHNDISQQMRNVARGMSHAEIEEAAQYYANQP